MNGTMVRALVAVALCAVTACARRPEKRAAVAGVDAGAAATAQPGATPTPTAATPARPPRPPREPEKTPDLKVPLRPLDKQILALAAKGFDPKKINAAFKKKPPVVEASGSAEKKSGRISIDLEGDRRVDETWHFAEDGKVTREVRDQTDQRDDGFVLEGQEWKLVSGLGRTVAQKPIQRTALRPMDREILAYAAKKTAPTDDAFPKATYRVAFEKAADRPTLNRAKVDLDRDGKWDEVWWIELPAVRREVSPQDDGRYSEPYRLFDNNWFNR